MTTKSGKINVSTSDIFPIIKKWLYSEHDIFIRELVANATDAITKRATFARTKNLEIPSGNINIEVNEKEKTVKIIDNGIGMTEADVEKYIAQLAFSGAEEFVQKMKQAGEGADIIGKFGLGFYSSFMVADKVQVDSLHYEEGATATRWICEGDVDYKFEASDKTEVGTTITLYINEESKDFLKAYKLNETLKQYCDFMPYQITLIDQEKIGKKREDGTEETSTWEINNTDPLWKKDPTTLKDEDYKKFYRELFPMDQEPLFWLHLKVDHPFTLDGILFFPKINPKMTFQEKNIRLYSKQVFVSDNVKNIIPDFLSLLKGVIDSTDIPLNVSRSSLQGDPNIKKISNYIVKKVAESLKKLYRGDRTKYEGIWEDSGIFVKYGCVSDTKFDELMREMILFKNSEQKLVTLPEYEESIPEKYKEKLKNKVIYFEKDKSDHNLRKLLLEEKIQTIEVDDHIDPHFMQHLEVKALNEKTYQFASVDSEISNLLESENTNENDMKVKELFQNILAPVVEPKEGEEKDPMAQMGSMEIEISKIKGANGSAYLKVDEQMKRFAKMAMSMGNNNPFPVKKTLVINPNSAIVQNALKIHEKGTNPNLVAKICHHVEDLAIISSEGLKQEEKEAFVQRTQDLVNELSTLAL